MYEEDFEEDYDRACIWDRRRGPQNHQESDRKTKLPSRFHAITFDPNEESQSALLNLPGEVRNRIYLKCISRMWACNGTRCPCGYEAVEGETVNPPHHPLVRYTGPSMICFYCQSVFPT
jgi:hypothetical protein